MNNIIRLLVFNFLFLIILCILMLTSSFWLFFTFIVLFIVIYFLLLRKLMSNINVWIVVFTIIIDILIMLFLLFYGINTKFLKTYTNMDFGIETYTSAVDKDSDGIDDQTDILNNAYKYISTKPKYKSKYYGTGYPDDSYGVCTDVVAFSLLNAGYDLMELVNEDIKLHRDDYNIDVIDKNIDFRRVKNLNVYFSHTAISLTVDINKIDEWQGGDIVVFKHHIGIVSDKRNSKGIPLIIHHANEFQKNYVEDILESHNDIIGHYRIS